MATTAEANYYSRLQQARLRRDVAKEQQNNQADVSSSTTRKIATSLASKAVALIPGIGLPTSLALGFALKHKWVLWLIPLGIMLLLVVTAIIIITIVSAPVFVLHYFKLIW